MGWKGVVFEDTARSSLLMLPSNFAELVAAQLQSQHPDAATASPLHNPMEKNVGGLFVSYSLDAETQTIVVHDINTRPNTQRKHADPR